VITLIGTPDGIPLPGGIGPPNTPALATVLVPLPGGGGPALAAPIEDGGKMPLPGGPGLNPEGTILLLPAFEGPDSCSSVSSNDFPELEADDSAAGIPRPGGGGPDDLPEKSGCSLAAVLDELLDGICTGCGSPLPGGGGPALGARLLVVEVENPGLGSEAPVAWRLLL
jgi:hypothetical protein